MIFSRDEAIRQIKDNPDFDLIIIGGGATGLGIAVDGAVRGYRVLLLEKDDFAKGTSSRSTKLVHGGVRYLANGDIGLVYEALHERDRLLHNAPHLVHRQPFIIPCYSWFEKLKYGVGLKFYDLLSSGKSFPKSRIFSKKEVADALPGIKSAGLKGGVQYYDGQFDDARLAVNLAQTAAEKGAVLVNYFPVTALQKNQGEISGVGAKDAESGETFSISAAVVINATGVFVDDIMLMDQPEAAPKVQPSQGVHLVFNAGFLPGNKALMIPKTSDGRVLFAVPWHDHLLIGTTDTPVTTHSAEPRALDQEIDFILKTAGQYLTRTPQKSDVLSVFAGLRPLAAPQKGKESTKEISRSHKLMVSKSGLITITGGKWTTYRRMAEDTIKKAVKTARISYRSGSTKDLPVHGALRTENTNDPLSIYGTDAAAIRELAENEPGLAEKITLKTAHIRAEVIWAVRYEMARTVEDVLARRLRILFLNAPLALEMAPVVAGLMAKELHKTDEWKAEQLSAFQKTASVYLL
ncbi:MAG: glycerol-3-phosphate dehydrogenase/oxidase [Mucilaginibacter polytrichastri]|nr:glycerol-3-phosphate dehydrogenase/oxidase [Mucilaginibacter polytrichastri]